MGKKKILIAEDETTLMKGLAKTLSIRGDVDVLEAVNGEEGVAIALKEHPDYLIFDVKMPVLDGLAAIAKLRKDEWGEKARIAIWTNSIGQETVDTIQNTLQVDEYWLKSDYSFKDISNMVREKLLLP